MTPQVPRGPSPGERLGESLARIRSDERLAPQIVAWRRLPAQPARYAKTPDALHPRLQTMLAARGIPRLYSHQARAVALALEGANVVVVTPTASGKTLCYQLPVLDRILRRPQSRALYLFPTKALAQDQRHGLARDLEEAGTAAAAIIYDGDTPQSRRRAARQAAQVLITNPDMLHVGILPYHTQWRELLTELDYVVIDEMHVYRGVFGSHVAHVLRRLRRLCAFYGSAPQFILASATIANPAELAQNLIGEPVQVVVENGAPGGERQVALVNPPVIEARLGIRRSPLVDARELALALVGRGEQVVCFTRSRLAVEQLVIALRERVERVGLSPEVVRGYRAGYLAAERREIEAGLRDGRVRCVVATSALELGIDIGGLTAAILVGYPGSVASTWQRIGRVGRGEAPSAAFMIASASPLDQYVMAHPEHLFGGGAEAARINPDNLYVRSGHEQAALYELPLDEDEAARDDDGRAILGALQAAGEARLSRGRWFWAGQGFPAGEISLRSAEAARVAIVAGREPEGRSVTIGEVERSDAPRWLHEEAIYLHEGRPYLVRTLDLEAKLAQVEPVTSDYYTTPSEREEIEIERTMGSTEGEGMTTAHGEIRLTRQVTGYRRQRFETQEVLGWGVVHLPEQVILTSAFWLGVQPDLVARLEAQGLWTGDQGGARGPDWDAQRALARQRDGYRCVHCGAPERPGRNHDVHHVTPFREYGWEPGRNDAYRYANQLSNLVTLCPRCHQLAERQVALGSTLADVGHLLRYLAPLWLLCDPGDIGIHADSAGRRAERPTLFIYDQIPGGAGLADQLPRLIEPLLDSAAQVVSRCPCESGCPACIGPALAPPEGRKASAIGLLKALIGTEPGAL
jgi:DEAD/DEAH box helicase domain-containing protein